MASQSESSGGSGPFQYGPYGPPLYGFPYGAPFGQAYAPPYLRQPVPSYPYASPFFAGGSPFGAPYSRETARKQELDFLKGQAEYFEDIVEGINKRIEELQAEGEAK